jgi:hypothetical protein
MLINRIKISEIKDIIAPRRGKYDTLREMFSQLTQEDALFVTDVKPALIYAALFPKRAHIRKADYEGETGYAVMLKEEKSAE